MTDEMQTFLLQLAVGFAYSAIWIAQLNRRDREIRYLRGLASDRNLWNVRCDVCCKPLRDRPTGTDTTVNPNGSKTSISYHLWGGCAEIFRKRADRPTA